MNNKEISDKDVEKMEENLKYLVDCIRRNKFKIYELISEEGKYYLQ